MYQKEVEISRLGAGKDTDAIVCQANEYGQVTDRWTRWDL